MSDWIVPRIAVVIATYNRPKTLFRLLDNLDSQVRIHLGRDVSVCVVDDGSDIDSTNLFPSFKFEFVYLYRPRSPNGLPKVYSSRNIAASCAKGDFILQLDDDVIFHERTLSELQNMAAIFEWFSLEHWVWIPRLSNNGDKCPHDNADYDYGPDGLWYDGKVEWRKGDWNGAHSCGMFMPRRTWDSVSGYDESFDGSMGWADQDLARRIYEKIGMVLYAPYFMHVADEETGSWREQMIARSGRDNSVIIDRKWGK